MPRARSALSQSRAWLAQACRSRVVELGGVLALAGGGQRGEAGGVVAVPGFQVVGQLGVGGEGGGVQAGRGVMELLGLADTGQANTLSSLALSGLELPPWRAGEPSRAA